MLLTVLLGYLDFLKLTSHARLILTASGGLPKEACILQVPCLTLSTSTGRTSAIATGSNWFADADKGGLSGGTVAPLLFDRQFCCATEHRVSQGVGTVLRWSGPRPERLKMKVVTVARPEGAVRVERW